MRTARADHRSARGKWNEGMLSPMSRSIWDYRVSRVRLGPRKPASVSKVQIETDFLGPPTCPWLDGKALSSATNNFIGGLRALDTNFETGVFELKDSNLAS